MNRSPASRVARGIGFPKGDPGVVRDFKTSTILEDGAGDRRPEVYYAPRGLFDAVVVAGGGLFQTREEFFNGAFVASDGSHASLQPTL
jgi:hypothetical protein